MRVIVVGGGLVGSMESCFMAKRGFQVDLYEAREDIRLQEHVKGRSINLALSIRGREPLRAVNLEEEVVAGGIPMYARLIHSVDGKLSSQPYGKKDQYILSVDRRKLNEALLTAAESNFKVTMHFNHKLLWADIDKGQAVFSDASGKEINVTADLIIGCDGAFSTLRKNIMKMTRFDYNQEYIPHGYMELNIPASEDDQFQMAVGYLHLWPRGQFMMIALPNQDKSFTLTLFMPFAIFDAIKSKEELLTFFKANFDDAISLVGEEELCSCYFSSKPLPLISIKCWPYHVGGTAVILGDAAHAMVPFFGQGMNCGLEDCLILDEMFDTFGNDLESVLHNYSVKRNPDAKAICDLAMYNYIEMRDLVNSPWFLFRKRVDNLLHWILPNSFIPLYSMVTFSRIRYHHIVRKWKAQSKMVDSLLRGTLCVAFAVPILYLVWKKQFWGVL